MDQEKQFRIWCQEIRAGDKASFNACFHSLYPELCTFAARYLRDRDAAMDMVQDAFVKLWNIRLDLNERKSLKAFMYTMVRNLCLNHIRDVQDKEALIGFSEIEKLEEPQADSSEAMQHKQKLRALIDQLPDRQKECLELSRFDGLSHQEIAEVLNLSARTVNNHIVSALKSLKTKFEQLKESTMVL